MFSPVSPAGPAWGCQPDAPAGVDHAQQLAAVEDGDTGHQGGVQLGFRDSYHSKRGFLPVFGWSH